MKDLASGAGGTFRYLVPIRDPRESKKITKLALIRQDHYDDPHVLSTKLGKHWYVGPSRHLIGVWYLVLKVHIS
ncbi:hypothetical protein MMYC01_210116 [Madurella mycetomatis]|uniref:Uncharacterized protein n=1 Tax=Madurella mycetomatis TaxID=100816 RepID=A0A175VQR5_9PEZI|nr:hypothetical protein MMYC01_210116 [Madurella mycetomatis]